jgi:GH24 family phage-related lysozyme (muramidase)
MIYLYNMNLLINENQLNRLIESVKVDKIKNFADAIWTATSGLGTDEEKVYQTLRQITNLETFIKVNTKLISDYEESFYDIVNSTMEFTDSEKQEIVKILNSNRIPHFINQNGDVTYNNKVKNVEPIKKVFTPQSGMFNAEDLNPSESLYNFLKCEEGKVGGKCQPELVSYKKRGDKWTIGWGHTGDFAKPGNKISVDKAEEILRKDAQEASNCVKRIFSDWKKKNIDRKITQSMFDTLTSLAFNAGCGSLRGGNSDDDVIDYVRKGKFADASKKILSFKSNKPGFSGLKTRREKESQMFCKEGSCV